MSPKKLNPTPQRSTPNPKLAKLIRASRLQAGLSETEVAGYLGVPAAVIKAYENGTRSIPLNDIYAMSNCLNISPDLIVSLLK